MKRLLASVAAAALLSSPVIAPQIPLVGVHQAQAQSAEVSISVFYDRLGEYGSWVSHPRYRYVWVPTDVDAGWVPYTNGHWVYTEQYGWYFTSEEPFAWAVYHYGRWAYDAEIGWFWVPGTRWAPAWVSWRRGEDYVGWAPLPPEGDGAAVGVEITTVEPPRGYWVFVPVNEFVAPDLTVVIVEREEIPVIYERTEIVGPVVVQNNVVVNNVIDIDFIEQHVQQEIEVVEVQEVQDPAEAAESDGVVAFTGEIMAEEDATPAEAVEPAQVESPTVGQEVEAEGTAGEAPAGGTTAPADATGQNPAEGTEQPPAEGTEQAPAEGADQAPAGGTEEAPAEDQPADGATGEETSAEQGATEEQAPAADQPADQAPAGEQPAEGQADEDAPAEEQPAEEQAPAADQAPAAEGQAPEEQPAEGTAPADQGEQAPAEEGAEQTEEAPEGAEEAPEAGQAPAAECSPEQKQAGQC